MTVFHFFFIAICFIQYMLFKVSTVSAIHNKDYLIPHILSAHLQLNLKLKLLCKETQQKFAYRNDKELKGTAMVFTVNKAESIMLKEQSYAIHVGHFSPSFIFVFYWQGNCFNRINTYWYQNEVSLYFLPGSNLYWR